MERFYYGATVPAADMQIYNRLYYIPLQKADAYSHWITQAEAGFSGTFEDGNSARLYLQYPQGESYPQVRVDLCAGDGHVIKTVKAHVSLINTTYFIGTRNKEYYFTLQPTGGAVDTRHFA